MTSFHLVFYLERKLFKSSYEIFSLAVIFAYWEGFLKFILYITSLFLRVWSFITFEGRKRMKSEVSVRETDISRWASAATESSIFVVCHHLQYVNFCDDEDKSRFFKSKCSFLVIQDRGYTHRGSSSQLKSRKKCFTLEKEIYWNRAM